MLERTEIYRHIHVLANRGQRPSSDDWLTLIETLDRLHPRLHDFLTKHEAELTVFEKKVCLLIHIGIKPTPISHMYGVSVSYLSQVRKELLKKLFDADGKPSDFDARICSMATFTDT